MVQCTSSMHASVRFACRLSLSLALCCFYHHIFIFLFHTNTTWIYSFLTNQLQTNHQSNIVLLNASQHHIEHHCIIKVRTIGAISY